MCGLDRFPIAQDGRVLEVCRNVPVLQRVTRGHQHRFLVGDVALHHRMCSGVNDIGIGRDGTADEWLAQTETRFNDHGRPATNGINGECDHRAIGGNEFLDEYGAPP